MVPTPWTHGITHSLRNDIWVPVFDRFTDGLHQTLSPADQFAKTIASFLRGLSSHQFALGPYDWDTVSPNFRMNSATNLKRFPWLPVQILDMLCYLQGIISVCSLSFFISHLCRRAGLPHPKGPYTLTR